MPHVAKARGTAVRRPARPTGTVTFLFTDIEGSTRRWEAHAEMADALAQHDAILERQIETHGGLVFKRMGDAFCAVFNRATDAAKAAAQVQHALSAVDFSSVGGLRVRIALHTGETEERGGDYFGSAVNRVARLLSIAHGDQIILSAVTAALIERDKPPELSLRDLGEHRLKDIDQPQRVFQLCAKGLREDFQRSAAFVVQTNLTQQLTSFVDRDDERAEIKRRLEQQRLITVLGTGGLGKSRLCLEAGAQVLDRYPDGVWLVELAHVSSPEFVPSALASVLNVHESPGRTLTESVVQALTYRDALLIFDNCEHVIDAAAALASAMLRSCGGIRIIATSRQPLRIAGEFVLHLGPLAYPDAGAHLTAATAMRYVAVALFLQRARAVRPDFALTDETAQKIGEICRRLDGIALAVELAAARTKALSVGHLSERLNERFRLLTGGSRTELPRHQTMRALIDWSYDLLDEREQRVFRHTGIFAGGFTLEAITAVAALEGADSLDVLDVISSLVEKSLVVAHTGDSRERYGLLESTRQYALDKLRDCGECEAASDRHADFYRRLAESADVDFYRRSLAALFAQLHQEYENFNAALLWTLGESRDRELGAAIAGTLDRFWHEGGKREEALHWLDVALQDDGSQLSGVAAARANLARAVLLEGTQKLQAAEEACARFEAAGDLRGLGHALRQLAVAMRQQRRFEEAERAARRAAELLLQVSDFGAHAMALGTLGSIRGYAADVDGSYQILQEALRRARDHRAEYTIVLINMYLAEVEFQRKQFGRAVNFATEALNGIGSALPRLMANLFSNRAAYRIALDQVREATQDVHEALCILRDVQDSYEIAITVQHAALLAAKQSNFENAARWIGYADNFYLANRLDREPTEAWIRDRFDDAFAGARSEVAEAELRRDGGALSEPQIIDEVLAATRA